MAQVHHHQAFDPLSVVQGLLERRADVMELLAVSDGGWEVWLQVELFLLLGSRYPASQGYMITREQSVYDIATKRCDILVLEPDPLTHHRRRHIIELKAEVKSDINYNNGRSSIKNRIWREIEKFNTIRQDHRPCTT